MNCTSIGALATLLCAPLVAQDQLTKLNVAALDRQGDPITGLKSTDFQVQEDGKSRDIAFFRFAGDQPSANKPEPGEYTNHGGAPSHPVVILLDLLSDHMLSGAMISDQLLRALKNRESSDGLYLYFLTSGGDLYPVHPLPKPGEAAAPTSAEPWTENLAPLLQTALKKLVGIRPVDDRDTKVRFDLTMHAMRELGGQMQLITGRKNLVWVTRGLPLNGPSISERGIVDFTRPLREVCEALEHAQIAVYPVGSVLASEDAMALEEMSSLTGGRKYGYGEVGQAVKDAVADSRGTYEIGYYTSAEKPDGKHHKLRVVCSHKDARVQTIPGFYSLLMPPKPADLEQMATEIALRSPFDATDIGLKVTASPDPATPQNMRFDIRIDPADLLLQQVQDHRTGKIDLLLAPYGPSGLEQAPNPLRLDVSLTQEQYASAAHDGIVLHRSAAVGSTVQKIRVIVVDGALGAAGSVTVPVQH